MIVDETLSDWLLVVERVTENEKYYLKLLLKMLKATANEVLFCMVYMFEEHVCVTPSSQ